MEQIIITHRNGSTLKLNSKENVSAITKASQTVELLGADVVDISVQSAKKMNFLLGDKITVIGRDYTLNTPAKERKISESNFQYDMQFEGVQYDLLRATFNVNIDTTSNEIQDISGDAITGNIKMFLDVIVANANRVFGSGKWTVGSYPANTKTVTLTFNDSDSCLTVLQNLCGEDNFGTEFKIGIDGSGNRTINVGTIGNNFSHTFEYGKGKGIYELTREKLSSSNIVTRLNAFGGSKNIITPKYRAAKLCLPTKSKSQSFIEDAAGISAYGIWESSKDFDDIYPHRTGIISALGSNVFEFVDSSMNFDLNEKNVDGTTKYLMAGTSAKIAFNTGNLAGYEFEVSTYVHSTKKFTIISQTDQNDYVFPSTSTPAFQFSIGDKYVITDIYMPQAYIDTAEAELATKAAAYLAKYSQPLVQYGLTIDSNFLKNQVGADASSNIIWVGDYIPIKDTDLEVDKTIRVKGFNRDLMLDYTYQLTIADFSITVSTINRVISGMNTVDKVIKINNLNDPAKARRNWKDSQEVLNMIFDPEGDFFTDKIKPLSIETSMLSVGSKSMQFGLEGTIFQPNYAGEKNRVVYQGGTLTHYAIFDANDEIRTWNIADGDVVMNSDTARYVYARCAKSGTGASILFSTDKITVDSDSSYYHFLLGMLNSVDVSNTRALALTYGFTTVNGRFIKTGRIQSADGSTYFDLDAGEFKGNFKFSSGTSVETAVTGAQSTATNSATVAATAQGTANIAVSSANTAQYTADTAKDLARVAQYGKMLYRDPSFISGNNGIYLYNNNGGTALTLTRVAKSADSPSSSGYELKLSYVGGSSGASPGLGGFYFGLISRPSAIFVLRFIAKIPVGYDVGYASNASGTGSSYSYLTPYAGTGKYEEYIIKIVCGATGTFSSVGFIYIQGTATPLSWYLSYATMIDLTDSDVYKVDEANYLKEAMGANTAIEGGLLSTSLIQVKDVNGNVTGGLSGLSSDNVVMFGGGTYADALQSATTPSAVAVIDRKDGSGHRAKGNLLWDNLGNLTVGLFKIVSGAITGFEGLYERIRISTAAITPLSTLIAGGWLREAKDYKYTSLYGGTLYNGYSDTPLLNSAYVSQSAVLNIPVATSIKIYSGGALSYTLANPSGITFNTILQRFQVNGTNYTLAAGANQTIALAAGSYTISYAIEATFYITRYSSSVINLSNASTAYVEVQSVAPSRTEIGSDGFFSFWATTQYFFYDKTNGLSIKGKTNIPGVLAIGSISSGGVQTNIWGAKSHIGNATYTATGIYDVIHTVGGTTYQVLTQPTVDGNRASIISKSANSFRVQVRNSANTVVAGSFDYTIMGAN
jgi:hypothetical protein